MNRSTYFDYIEEKLNFLSYRINLRGKLNILNFNIHAEVFYTNLMNNLFGYSLVNLNTLEQNVEAIDLVDTLSKVMIQVSSTCTKQKVENSLNKIDKSKYSGYQFKFIALTVDGNGLRTKKYPIIEGIKFRPSSDIYDVKAILDIVLNLTIDKQIILYNFIRDELGSEVDVVKIDSNLTEIINILSSENLSIQYESPEINSFEIKRKIDYNNLASVLSTIDDYKVFIAKSMKNILNLIKWALIKVSLYFLSLESNTLVYVEKK